MNWPNWSARKAEEGQKREGSEEKNMGKKSLMLAISLGFVFLLNLSCEEKSTRGGERTDFDAIKAIIYENPDIFLVDVFDTDKDTSVNPVFFREITSRDFDLDSARRYGTDSSHPYPYIYAAWGDSIRGILHYFIDRTEHTKPIYAHSRMGAYFEQWGDILDPHRGWLLKKISNNVIASVPTHIVLPAVHITSEGVNTWVSEGTVSSMVKKDSVLSFTPGKKVTFTVESEDISDSLHIGEDGHFRKTPFADNGDGTSSASWTTTTDPEIAKGYKHAFVDAVSRDALTDTTAEYDSKAWGIIYRIK
jgi:hypothetical protein